jgi:hypothetical protein
MSQPLKRGAPKVPAKSPSAKGRPSPDKQAATAHIDTSGTLLSRFQGEPNAISAVWCYHDWPKGAFLLLVARAHVHYLTWAEAGRGYGHGESH